MALVSLQNFSSFFPLKASLLLQDAAFHPIPSNISPLLILHYVLIIFFQEIRAEEEAEVQLVAAEVHGQRPRHRTGDRRGEK